jgi:hypothetical protein
MPKNVGGEGDKPAGDQPSAQAGSVEISQTLADTVTNLVNKQTKVLADTVTNLVTQNTETITTVATGLGGGIAALVEAVKVSPAAQTIIALDQTLQAQATVAGDDNGDNLVVRPAKDRAFVDDLGHDPQRRFRGGPHPVVVENSHPDIQICGVLLNPGEVMIVDPPIVPQAEGPAAVLPLCQLPWGQTTAVSIIYQGAKNSPAISAEVPINPPRERGVTKLCIDRQ